MLSSLVVLLSAAFALYAGSFGHAWILDDFPVIVNNPDVQSLSGFLADSYPGRPLRELTFLLDHALFGLEPAGWHVQNIFWHALNAWLLFVLAARLGAGRFVAWSAALLFLVHPVQVEVVANISHRKDSLALACILLATLAYLRTVRPEGRRLVWLAAAVGLALVGWTAKENVLVLPLLWLGYELAFLAPQSRLLLRFPKWLGAAAVIACAGFFGWYLLAGGMAFHQLEMTRVLAKMTVYLEPGSVAPYFLMVLKSLAFMVGKLVWPLQLAPEYVYPAPSGWLDPWVLAALAILVVYGLLLWRTWRRWPPAFFALLWIGLFWLPTSNLWPLSYFAADRYLYTPTLGLALLTGLVVERWCPRRNFLPMQVMALGLLACGLLTWQQNRVWATPLSLWSQAVRVAPESTSALNNLGGAYLQLGQLEKSLEYFHKAARNFDNPMPWYNLGRVYEQLGDRDKAIFNYRSFLAFGDPGTAQLANRLRLRLLQQYGIQLR
ncbi:hypothetical protein [Trichloromonas sp.]|uniref:hypothetical protein n=1 Tax=Trichloromonas sp. TaxID=3069249 RepID=UPI003D814BFE